jgi:hypothetical protein
VAVITPGQVRAYPRDAVRVGYGVDVRHGLEFRMVLSLPRDRRDTVFRRLSVRDVYELARRVEQWLPAAGGVRGRLAPR